MLSRLALSAYRVMWIMVSFDIPTCDKHSRASATQFRKDLLGDGFRMFQYSVYIRHCGSREHADVHMERVRNFAPDVGMVSMMRITDKQFGEIEVMYGKRRTPPPEPTQLFDEF